MTSSKHGAPKLWASVSLRVHICAMEYGQLITTCTCANFSEYILIIEMDWNGIEYSSEVHSAPSTVQFSNGIKNQTIKYRTNFDHAKTELVRYLDPCCIYFCCKTTICTFNVILILSRDLFWFV